MPWMLHRWDVNRHGDLRDGGFWEITDDLPEEVCDWVGTKVRVENINGGWNIHTITEHDDIFIGDWDEIDFSYILDPTSDYGWIAPDGTWYGCSSMEHSLVADLVLKSDERTLEHQGYVKIYGSYITGRDYYIGQRLYGDEFGLYSNKLTEAQEKVLIEKGLTIREYERINYDG